MIKIITITLFSFKSEKNNFLFRCFYCYTYLLKRQLSIPDEKEGVNNSALHST